MVDNDPKANEQYFRTTRHCIENLHFSYGFSRLDALAKEMVIVALKDTRVNSRYIILRLDILKACFQGRLFEPLFIASGLL